jgi:hypothetical protein
VTEQGSEHDPVLGHRDPNNRFRHSLEQTEQVKDRLVETLDGRIGNLFVLMGMVPNATRRIATEIEQRTAQDACAVFHASRLYTNIEAAYLLLQRGLIVEATILTRSALESVAQAIVFLRDASAGEKWLNGKRYAPVEIRRMLGPRPDFKPLYQALSAVAHSNPEARWAHSVVVPDTGVAVAYGGFFQPKTSALVLEILVDLLLFYLQEFYEQYVERLSVEFWPVMLDAGREMNSELHSWRVSLPEDWAGLVNVMGKSAEPPMPPSVLHPDEIDRLRRHGL